MNQLIVSPSLLQRVLNTLRHGVVVCEAVCDQLGSVTDLRLTMVNEQAAQLLKRPVSRLVGQLYSHIFPADLHTAQFTILQRVIQTGQSDMYELPVPDLTTPTDWYEVTVDKLGDGLMLTFTRITDRKRAELVNEQQTTTQQTVIDNTQAGTLLVAAERDETGQIIDFRFLLTNRYNAERGGKTIAEMTGRLVGDVFSGWQESDLFQRFVAVVETGQSQKLTFPYNEYNWTGWYEGTFTKVGDGLLYTYTDVTPLKEAELTQQHQAEHLQHVLDSALTAIAEYKAIRNETGQIVDFHFVSFNRMAEQITGLKAADVVGNQMLVMFPGVKTSGLFERWVRLTETGQTERFTDYYNFDGIELWYDTQAVKYGDGFIQSYVDISPLMRNQRDLELLNQELQRSNDNLQSFAYVASHDLQEPLRKIQTFGDLLVNQQADRLDESGREHLQRMQHAAGRMSMLIKDLLNFSRVITQQEPFDSVNLTELITDVLRDVEIAADEADALVSYDNLPIVSGDRSQLKQLFQNLLTNAFKFRKPDQPAVVSITAREVGSEELADNPFRTGRYHEISVVDQGIGFEQKYAERIFQVFQRLHGRARYGGSGVGLAICKRVVSNHKGLIEANSEPNAGSTFRVYLPLL